MKSIYSENRPWVIYVIHDESNYKLKRIEVKPGHRLSYQYHTKNLKLDMYMVMEK